MFNKDKRFREKFLIVFWKRNINLKTNSEKIFFSWFLEKIKKANYLWGRWYHRCIDRWDFGWLLRLLGQKRSKHFVLFPQMFVRRGWSRRWGMRSIPWSFHWWIHIHLFTRSLSWNLRIFIWLRRRWCGILETETSQKRIILLILIYIKKKSKTISIKKTTKRKIWFQKISCKLCKLIQSKSF